MWLYIGCAVQATSRPPFLSFPPPFLQAKDALNHPYFADLDKATVDKLENPAIAERDQDL